MFRLNAECSGVLCTVSVGQYKESTTKIRYFFIKYKICIKKGRSTGTDWSTKFSTGAVNPHKFSIGYEEQT